MMSEYGFKTLTVDNWLERDETISAFSALRPDGTVTPIADEEWVAEILEPQLDESVPLCVRELYEVARGAMTYGVLFYPLFALAEEQLYRVAEAAVRERCRAEDIGKEAGSFKGSIDLLVKHGVIAKKEHGVWDALRSLRNFASHPGDQSIQAPGPAVGHLYRMAERINSLFAGRADAGKECAP